MQLKSVSGKCEESGSSDMLTSPRGFIFLLFLLIMPIVGLSELYAQEVEATPGGMPIDSNQFSGTWYRTDPDSVVLEVIYHSLDSFRFEMINYNPEVYGFIGGDAYSNDKYADILSEEAYFNDSDAISDGRPLYHEGEKPCELMFKILNGNTMEIYEENCRLIYGGDNATWGGIYYRIRVQK